MYKKKRGEWSGLTCSIKVVYWESFNNNIVFFIFFNNYIIYIFIIIIIERKETHTCFGIVTNLI